jgi:hypothetical protein
VGRKEKGLTGTVKENIEERFKTSLQYITYNKGN